MYVSYNKHSSGERRLTYGVPQGSVLGPLLFITYINDLPSCLKNAKSILFADDTTIYCESDNIKTLYKNMNMNLEILNDWLQANKLSLNIMKTKCMIFSNVKADKHVTSQALIGNTPIEQVNYFKFLGLIIDQNLTWGEHIKYVKSKLSSALYGVNSVKNLLPRSHLRMIYSSLFQPHLDYGLLLWGSTFQSYVRPITVLQKKCIRSIMGANYNAHTADLFKDLNLLPVDKLWNFQVGKFMYMSLNNQLPVCLSNIYRVNNDIHNHNTRQRLEPHRMKQRTTLAANSFISKGPSLWHELPNNLKTSENIKIFSHRLRNLLIL